MAVNLAIKYASQLDQIWTHASYTDNWINKKYDFGKQKLLSKVIFGFLDILFSFLRKQWGLPQR